MKPKRIILVRHGQSIGNADKTHYENVPDYSLDLTETGREQSRAAGRAIAEIIGDGTVRVYVSPWFRTRQTFAGIASVLGDRIVKMTEDPRLRDQDWGHYQSKEALDKIKAARNEYSTFYYRIPDGESAADVYDRTSAFLETLHRDFESDRFPDNAVIITHGVTLRAFLMRWFHWTPEFYSAVRNPETGEVLVMERGTDGQYILLPGLRLRYSLSAAELTEQMTPCLTMKVCGFTLFASYSGSKVSFFRRVPGTTQHQIMAEFGLKNDIASVEAAEKLARKLWDKNQELILSARGIEV